MAELLVPKTQVLVAYVGWPNEWHARLLLSRMDAAWWCIITPDDDCYCEDLSGGSGDILAYRLRPADGSLPFGMEQRHVYDFRVQPSPAQIDVLAAEGVREAQLERGRRGIPEPVVPGADALVLAVVPPVPPVPIAGVPVGGGLVGGVGGVPLGGAGVLVGGLGLLPPPGVGAGVLPGGAGRLVPPPAGGGGVPVAGVGALAAAVGVGGVGVAGAVPLAGGLLGGGVGGVAAATADAALDGDDLRTLAVAYDANGQRHRDFREAISRMSSTAFTDFPVAGPRTLEWVLRFLLDNGPTPRGWHNKWRADGRLQPTDAGVAMHEVCCLVLETMVVYDQLAVTNLASAEQIGRQLQLIEEKWKDRFGQSDGSAEDNTHLYLGAQHGHICVCPALQAHIADELRKEAAVSKERRKAREERQLAKPKKGGNP